MIVWRLRFYQHLSKESQNLPISGPFLMKKANIYVKQFTVNPGWLERFRKRNGIVNKELFAAGSYNTDEAGIFNCCLLHKTLAFKGEWCLCGKRYNFMVAYTFDGSMKLLILLSVNT